MKRSVGLKILGVSFAIGALVVLWIAAREDRSPTQENTRWVSSNEAAAILLPVEKSSSPDSPSTQFEVESWLEAEVIGKLREFADLNRKLFRSEDEANSMNRLLSDANFHIKLTDSLRSLAQLDQSELSEIRTDDIDHAIDVLIAAQAEGSDRLILKIVTDTAVDNKDLPPAGRQALAGVQGELMFRLIDAKNRRLGQELSQVRLGLTGELVRERVLRKLESNRAESLALANAVSK